MLPSGQTREIRKTQQKNSVCPAGGHFLYVKQDCTEYYNDQHSHPYPGLLTPTEKGAFLIS